MPEKGELMIKRNIHSLSFKFTIIFTIFTIITLSISGVMTYISQNNIYLKQCETDIQNIGDYLRLLMEADDIDFIEYQNYYMKHYTEMKIPMDVKEYKSYKKTFDDLFAKKYPDKTLGIDISMDELDAETQMAYYTYKHVYWLLTFEQSREAFHIPMTYYVVPAGKPLYMTYMVDAVREAKETDASLIELGITVEEPLKEHQTMWEAWNTGQNPEGYDVYDNELGHTYAYYVPLIIRGEKIGVIGTEIEVDAVNHEILMNTLKQLGLIAVVLLVCVTLMIAIINRKYILKISHLAQYVNDYKISKDPETARLISAEIAGNDELAVLSRETSAMIFSIEDYIKNLDLTKQELATTKDHVSVMKELANKDALTGLRNKTAYDNEIKRLEWMIDDGTARFGIAIIDLNFLKRINDTYGHDKGNAAIKSLCRLVCTIFAHSPVFRIGGDEFVVILENGDYDDIELLLMDFNQKIEEYAQNDALEPWEKVSAAIGYAIYDKFIDNRVDNVFKRADKAMYQKKKSMKAVRED